MDPDLRVPSTQCATWGGGMGANQGGELGVIVWAMTTQNPLRCPTAPTPRRTCPAGRQSFPYSFAGSVLAGSGARRAPAHIVAI